MIIMQFKMSNLLKLVITIKILINVFYYLLQYPYDLIQKRARRARNLEYRFLTPRRTLLDAAPRQMAQLIRGSCLSAVFRTFG